MTAAEAVAALNAIDVGVGPEGAHIMADEFLLAAASPRVREAYARCQARTGRWWYA